ncbi:hypothetical protein [Pseudobythopirellula maris]|uniref:hypothetical protein n=1 Tax=Pseudobythopirellula maris TaxID=2527991 RepID=UPI0011B40918|nr:hypothetical protein [Pseudobythopirellula maris]
MLEPRSVATPPSPQSPLAALGEISFCDYCGGGCQGGSCCPDCQGGSKSHRFLGAVYRGLCCPDPCYQPVWRPTDDAAFYTTAARPVNQQRFRWDHGNDLVTPDRAEFFWARADTTGAGPRPAAGGDPAFGPVDYDEIRHYTEVAHGSFGASVEYSYRSVEYNGAGAAGFGDLTIGTKTMIFDTELMQIAFQMNTHVPQGSARKGLGTGHVSLELGLVFGLSLTPDTFVQADVSEWIPLGGDADYAGAVVRYNASCNHVLWRPHRCMPLIAVSELSGWRFQDGAFTGPTAAQATRASGSTYLQGSLGMRLFFCDRADFGVSYTRPVGDYSWVDSMFRTELRFRY